MSLGLTVDFYDAFVKVADLDEGISENNKPAKYGMPYKDSQGYWTIGRGHLIGKELTELKLSQRIVDELFMEDLAIAIRDAKAVIGVNYFNSLCLPRQVAVVSLTYTLGKNKFLKFDETIEAIIHGYWDSASAHVLASKWARDVDPKQRPGIGRDDRVAYMLKTGEFHPDYGIV